MAEEESARYQAELQDILMEISTRFINIPLDNIEHAVLFALERLGRFIGADRGYIYEYNYEGNIVRNTYEWCNEGVASLKELSQKTPLKKVVDWIDQASVKQVSFMHNLSHLPEGLEYIKLKKGEHLSLLNVKLIDGNNSIGFVGFESKNSLRNFSKKELGIFQLFSYTIVSLFKRYEYHRELVLARSRAEAANRAKSEFLASMSHEIRTPLNGVIGFTDLLKKTNLNALQRQYVENANASGHSLLTIIDDILDFSKIEADMFELEMIPTDLFNVFQLAIELIKHTAEEKNLELQLNYDTAMPRYVIVDPFRLQQILLNLLGNAVKFTEKGRIELAIEYERREYSQGLYRISVKDTGIGMNKEHLQKLFKPFSQADMSTSRKFGGTGLGLIISDRIAQKFGSKIEVESQVGAGSIFYFDILLKISSTPPQQEMQGPESKKRRDIRKRVTIADYLKVIVAEDVPMNMLLIRSLLEKILPNANIIEAIDGKQALAVYMKENPDLIIMDVQMPEIDGLEVTKTIRQREEVISKHTPIIALTAGAFKNEKERCLEAGMDYFFPKPIDQEKLEGLLQRLFPSFLEDTPMAPSPLLDEFSALVDFDTQFGLNYTGNDASFYRELLEQFKKDLEQHYLGAAEILRTASAKEGKRLVHNLKSTASIVGANVVADIAKEIDFRYYQNKLIEPYLIDNLEKAIHTAYASLEAFFASS